MNNAAVKMFMHRTPSPEAVFYRGRNRGWDSGRLSLNAGSPTK